MPTPYDDLLLHWEFIRYSILELLMTAYGLLVDFDFELSTNLFPHMSFVAASAQFAIKIYIQSSAERWLPGCVNAAGKARQKRYARAVTKFTKPGDRLLAEPCKP